MPVEGLLRDRHRILDGEPDDFTVPNLADMADLASESSKVMTALLGSNCNRFWAVVPEDFGYLSL